MPFHRGLQWGRLRPPRGAPGLGVLVCVALLGGPLATGAGAGQPVSPYDPDTSGFAPSALADQTASDSWTLDTGTGQITDAHGTVRGPGAGVVAGIGVRFNVGGVTEFVMRSLTVAPSVILTTAGSSPLALLTTGNMTFGTLSAISVNGQGGAGGSTASANSPATGPGHGANGSCPSGATSGAGGGGGFGGSGGTGGAGAPGSGVGGASYGGTDQSVALLSGSGGGSASLCPSGSPQPASAGGGGLALVSLGTLTIADHATVTASGLDGTAVTSQAGGGGGSGGGLALLAPRLSLSPSAAVLSTGGKGDSATSRDGGGGGGGGRVTTVGDQPLGPTAVNVTGGPGGTSTTGTGGAPGADGSWLDRAFLDAQGPASAAIGQSVSFSAATAIGATTYVWDFGDGATASGPNPSHAFAVGGTHTVTVTATMSDSSTTVSRQLQVTVPAAPSAGTASNAPAPSTSAAHGHAACVVPHLRGLSLSHARARLLRAHCTLGKVVSPRRGRRPVVVLSQSARAGSRLRSGARVGVALGLAPKPHKRLGHR